MQHKVARQVHHTVHHVLLQNQQSKQGAVFPLHMPPFHQIGYHYNTTTSGMLPCIVVNERY